MSIAIPFLAFLLVGAIAAYHRLRLPVWAALTATVLVGCYLLGANPTATVEHHICIVPKPPHEICANHDRAVAAGLELAKRLGVDAWLTEDHCHFLRLGRFRT